MHAGWSLVPASWRRATRQSRPLARSTSPPGGVGGRDGRARGSSLVLLGCGAVELCAAHAAVHARRRFACRSRRRDRRPAGCSSLAWVAFKVGALSYGGGFVIVPLMQADAVDHYHWMTDGQFLNAVALGQITPGPVVQTVAVVGYAAAGVGGGLLAAAVAFSPSFAFVLVGGSHFDRIRANERARAFLDGAGPAAIGAILGSADPARRARSASRGSTASSPARRCSCSRCAAAWC